MKVQSTLLAVSGLLSAVTAMPAVKRDSAINEPAVEAPNGTPITLTPGPMPTGVDNSNSPMSSCMGSNCDSNNNNMNNCMNGDCNTSTVNSCMSGDCNTSTLNSCMSGDCNTSTTESYTSTMDSCMSGDCNTSTTESYTSTMDSCMNGDCNTSTMDSYYTSTADSYYTSTADSYYTSTTMTELATSTWSSYSSMATYGSGYMPPSYDSCVQQCINSYGAPPSMVTATPSMPPSYDNGASGTGATHTVIVAPSPGVLRYVPFAVNASVGDTVRFVWNAGPHTVTKSSALNLCNASMDNPFKSGQQNASFVFDQVVNDTNPTFYYCGVPNHCEKGMFGIINPPNAEPGAQNTAQGMMAMMAQNSSDFASQWSYTVMNTNNNTWASMWGSNMDVTKMTNDPAAQMALLQNVMFTRLSMASNDKFITSTGGFNPNPSAGMAVPMDPLKLSTNGTYTTPAGSDNAGSAPASTTGSTAPAASSSTSGAGRTITSSATAIFAAAAIAALVL